MFSSVLMAVLCILNLLFGSYGVAFFCAVSALLFYPTIEAKIVEQPGLRFWLHLICIAGMLLASMYGR